MTPELERLAELWDETDGQTDALIVALVADGTWAEPCDTGYSDDYLAWREMLTDQHAAAVHKAVRADPTPLNELRTLRAAGNALIALAGESYGAVCEVMADLHRETAESMDRYGHPAKADNARREARELTELAALTDGTY